MPSVQSGNPIPTNEEVLDLFSSSAVRFFSTGELFHDMYRMGIFVFQFNLSMFCPELSLEETNSV
jgi:hypothetical protein